jgi:hypothetical protein
MGKLTVDSICAIYAEKGAKITVKPLPKYANVILFEGDELAFEFLGKLFLAQAKAINGCGFEIGSKYAGSALFAKKATLGLYLHRLPCDGHSLKAEKATRKKRRSGTHN